MDDELGLAPLRELLQEIKQAFRTEDELFDDTSQQLFDPEPIFDAETPEEQLDRIATKLNAIL